MELAGPTLRVVGTEASSKKTGAWVVGRQGEKENTHMNTTKMK